MLWDANLLAGEIGIILVNLERNIGFSESILEGEQNTESKFDICPLESAIIRDMCPLESAIMTDMCPLEIIWPI
jgi:hypothetical protein